MRVRKGTLCAAQAKLAVLAIIVYTSGLIGEVLAQQASGAVQGYESFLPPPRRNRPPTYTKDVAAILQSKCQNCHRRHQVGPFALETYEQARKRRMTSRR